jgi:hypothetical protein
VFKQKYTFFRAGLYMLTFEPVKKMIAILLIAVLAAGCNATNGESAPSVEEPEDLIQRDKMIQVIADVHLLEAAAGLRAPVPPSRMPNEIPGQPNVSVPAPMPEVTQQKNLPYYDIFKQHGVTLDQYQRSYKWYTMDPEEFGLMYDEVINELTRRQIKDQAEGNVAVPAKPNQR